MTVFENVLVCAAYGRGMSERASYERCVETLELTRLSAQGQPAAGALPLLDRKRLELARALAGDPSVLLLDEIAGGLTESEVEVLIGTIKDLRPRASRSSGSSTSSTRCWPSSTASAPSASAATLIEGDPNEVMCSDEVQACYMGGTPI